MVYVVTRFDLRSPGAGREETGERYRAAIDLAQYADESGHDAVNVSEHHGSPDGYLPSPLVLASAIAARTERISISVWALIAPLYEPARLAEDIAVLDLVSAGRVNYTFGLGYRRAEYALHGRDWSRRGRRMDEILSVLRSAWSGEVVVDDDPGAAVDGHRLTPGPLSERGPLIFLGGGAAAARRAARHRMSYQPQIDDPALGELYRAECERLGHKPGLVVEPVSGPATVFCAEDPDEFWERYGQHLLDDALAYDLWQAERDGADPAAGAGRGSFVHSSARTLEDLRAEGVYLVASPDELVESCRSGELGLITAHPLCCGMPVDVAWESMRLLGEKVVPNIR